MVEYRITGMSHGLPLFCRKKRLLARPLRLFLYSMHNTGSLSPTEQNFDDKQPRAHNKHRPSSAILIQL